MDENLIREVDQAIEEICKYIRERTNRNNTDITRISEMTNALAALINARANARNIVKIRQNVSKDGF